MELFNSSPQVTLLSIYFKEYKWPKPIPIRIIKRDAILDISLGCKGLAALFEREFFHPADRPAFLGPPSSFEKLDLISIYP